jgi:hypothetical protein
MAQDYGEGDWSVTVHEMAVAAADARRADLDQDLSRLGVVQLHVFNHQR